MKAYYKFIIAVGVLLGVTFAMIKYVLPYFTPFVIAVILACVIDPPVNYLERRFKMPRAYATLVVLSVVVLIMIAVVTIGVAQVVTEVEDLSRSLPDVNQLIGRTMQDIIESVKGLYAALPQPFVEFIQQNQNAAFGAVQSLAGYLTSLIGGFPRLFVTLFLSVLATYFITKDKDLVTGFLLKFTPLPLRAKVLRMRREMADAVVGYIRAQVILVSITTMLVIVGLSLMGVRYAWLLGLAAGLLDLIPMVGPAVLFIPWIAYAFLTGAPAFGVGLSLVFGISLFVRQVSEARVVGRNMGIHPLAALISVYVGLELFGVAGFIIGPLTVIFLRAVISGIILPLFPHDAE